MSSVILDTAFQQGFLYVIAVFGVVISFRMMNFPDLTADGSFTLGGAVMATLLVNGYPIIVATCLTMVAGFVAGMVTAILNRKLGISKILSGILVMLILYSINLRIMGKANVSLLRTNTFFTAFETGNNVGVIVVLTITTIILLLILCYFATTRLGLFIRATGDNEFMVRSQGVNTDYTYLVGIGMSNSLIALSGGMVAQSQGFADVSMGIGLIITALAALIIGESVVGIWLYFKNKFIISRNQDGLIHKLPWDIYNELISATIGSVIYFFIIAICLQLGLAPTDLKLATGFMVIIGIAIRFKQTISETYQKSRL